MSPRTEELQMAEKIRTVPWRPTHSHRKGGQYRMLGECWIEAGMVRAVVYDDSNGDVWVRPISEFHDGRFVALNKPTEGHAHTGGFLG